MIGRDGYLRWRIGYLHNLCYESGIEFTGYETVAVLEKKIKDAGIKNISPRVLNAKGSASNMNPTTSVAWNDNPNAYYLADPVIATKLKVGDQVFLTANINLSSNDASFMDKYIWLSYEFGGTKKDITAMYRDSITGNNSAVTTLSTLFTPTSDGDYTFMIRMAAGVAGKVVTAVNNQREMTAIVF